MQYYHTTEAQTRRKPDNPSIQKGLDAITSSLNYLGGTIGNAFEVILHKVYCFYHFVILPRLIDFKTKLNVMYACGGWIGMLIQL